jgi:hypothetical protein
MIGILEKQMQRSFEGRRCMYEEICTLLQETTQIVNTRLVSSGQ